MNSCGPDKQDNNVGGKHTFIDDIPKNEFLNHIQNNKNNDPGRKQIDHWDQMLEIGMFLFEKSDFWGQTVKWYQNYDQAKLWWNICKLNINAQELIADKCEV